MIRQNDFIDDAARISIAQTRIAGGDECAGTLRMKPAHNIAMDRSESDTMGETGEFQAESMAGGLKPQAAERREGMLRPNDIRFR